MRLAWLVVGVVVSAVLTGCGGGGGAPPSPRPTAAPSPSPSAAASATPTQSPVISLTPTPVPTPTPTTAGFFYTVQPGDTLYSIARRFGTTVEAIAAANHLADPGQISAGQVLLIPVVGTPLPTGTPGAPAQVIRRGNPSRRMVAFTFDAGSDAGYTAQILDILKANGIKGTFGITGKWAQQNPDLLKRIVAEGHTLINHSYDHPSFTGSSTGKPPLTQAERWQQLDETQSIVEQLTGATTKPYFRPPYGDYDDSVNVDVGARGYAYDVIWTVDSGGWQGIPAAAITQRCLSLAEPGAIYVFHVGSASQDGPALQSVIDGLHAAGYTIGSLPDVLAP